MEVTLSPELERLVQEHVAQGGYRNASALIDERCICYSTRIALKANWKFWCGKESDSGRLRRFHRIGGHNCAIKFTQFTQLEKENDATSSCPATRLERSGVPLECTRYRIGVMTRDKFRTGEQRAFSRSAEW